MLIASRSYFPFNHIGSASDGSSDIFTDDVIFTCAGPRNKWQADVGIVSLPGYTRLYNDEGVDYTSTPEARTEASNRHSANQT